MKLICPVPADAWVSVSGGVDSVVAFHFLHTRHKVNGIFHFNHHCQDANLDMQNAVTQLSLDFPKSILMVGHAKTVLKSEAGYRKARLHSAFEGFHSKTLVTGHHLNDAVESHFLNVIRGHDGWAPMPVRSCFPDNNKIIHPFLLIPKRKLFDYAEKHDLLKYVVRDPSNEENKGSRRNFLRNTIIPLLEKERIGMETIVKKKLIARYCNAITE